MSSGNDLKGKSVEQLLEILERQEKLVNNRKFLARLPDKGKKILEFTEKVRLAIAESQALKRTGDLIAAFKGDFQAAQTRENKTSEKVEVGSPLKTWALNTHLAEETLSSSQNINIVAGPQNPTEEPSRSYSIKTEITADHKDDLTFNADTLANDLKNIHIKDGVEETNRSAPPTTSSMQGINPPFLNAAKTKLHYVEVLENRAHRPIKKKEKYMPSRFPSGSNSSSASQSPGGRGLTISAEERRAQDKKHLNDITAASFPPLHHAPAQLLPLEESIALQLAQNKTYEEQQAKLAAGKLMERMNIKMVKSNPEGDSYLKYRDLKDDDEEDT
ncbi:DNA-directed RNA polymerase II subunit GRINL1A [Xenopus laevis]|uniref:RNA polymerase II subunit M n=2 Tax=Xenopus laevis TaxID=8355 RepID=A0A974DF99_XENLA|nr:DNA-directed RNA polymerase II subunit GRINL1A [Xenopus laevis]OCT89547.1 hypothetical protein XELAEV_18018169mg [Xenopus laevis]